MKLINTALALAAIFFTKAFSLDFLSWSTHSKVFAAKKEKIVASCYNNHMVLQAFD